MTAELAFGWEISRRLEYKRPGIQYDSDGAPYLGLTLAGLPMLVSTSLPLVLAGLAIVGVGAFFAQATATGFVGRAAKHDRAAASGLYLSSYYLGGLAGAALLGRVFDAFGWPATVAAIAASIALAGALAAMLKPSTAEPARDRRATLNEPAH